MDSLITTEEFVSILFQNGGSMPPGDILANALAAGILDPLDRVLAGGRIERRAAARILRRFLKQALQEVELPDWEPAKKLKDLYDCRSCVDHVGQVYCKGIMDGKLTEAGEWIFGMRDNITRAEAEEIIKRVFDRERRYKIGERREE